MCMYKHYNVDINNLIEYNKHNNTCICCVTLVVTRTREAANVTLYALSSLYKYTISFVIVYFTMGVCVQNHNVLPNKESQTTMEDVASQIRHQLCEEAEKGERQV